MPRYADARLSTGRLPRHSPCTWLIRFFSAMPARFDAAIFAPCPSAYASALPCVAQPAVTLPAFRLLMFFRRADVSI